MESQIKKFEMLNLHGEAHDKEDFESRPFIQTAKLQEDHKRPIYGCCFNHYADDGDVQTVATVGGRFLHFYEVSKETNILQVVGACEFPTDCPTADKREESLFVVTWCLDTFELENGQFPLRVVVAGALGHIYVINTKTRTLTNRLRGVGWEINDLRTCPTNSNLVACASSDQSVRIHHIRNEACLVVIGGIHCHSGTILSVDWASDGSYLLSCGFDHQVMKWDLSKEEVHNHLKAACKAIDESPVQNSLNQDTRVPGLMKRSSDGNLADESRRNDAKTNAFLRKKMREHEKQDSCLFPIYTPSGVCSDLHSEYVDCVRVLPCSPYVFSKGCGTERQIKVWRFGAPMGKIDRGRANEEMFGAETCTTKLLTLEIPSGEPWFVKFDLDPMRRWLVCGGIGGVVNFFDLRLKKDGEPTHTIQVSSNTVRQVSFSTCGRFLVAVCDGAFVHRFDRVPASVDRKELAKF